MMRRHRRRHVILWLVIAPVLGLGIWAALTARTEVPASPGIDALSR